MAMTEPDLSSLDQTAAGQAEHLIIAFAVWPDAAAALQTLSSQQWGSMKQLLGGLQQASLFKGEPDSLSPPHERALAHALGWSGLADGLLPWAAEQAVARGLPSDQAWGLVSLCHWAMGREQASLSDPAQLPISEAESLALMADMAPFFATDGLQLHHLRPGQWLAQGEPMEQPTASLDRVIGRDVDPWLPSGESARLLRRLQGEMQMLLYTHPINEARAAQRVLPINSLWFSGTGRLPTPAQPRQGVHLSRMLAPAAMAGDGQAYAQAWVEVQQRLLQPLLMRQKAGRPVTLTLCGEQGYLTLEPATRGLMGRLARRVRPIAWPLKEAL